MSRTVVTNNTKDAALPKVGGGNTYTKKAMYMRSHICTLLYVLSILRRIYLSSIWQLILTVVTFRGYVRLDSLIMIRKQERKTEVKLQVLYWKPYIIACELQFIHPTSRFRI